MRIEKQKECIELLIKVDTIFKENSIPYWLDGGTLLCAYRDGNLDNEYDIDIGIFGEDYEKVIALNPMFQKVGYGTLDYRTKLYNVVFSAIEPSEEGHLLDMVTWYKLDDNIRSCLGERMPFTMPLDFFELGELSFYKLSPRKFPVPIKVKEYLERLFGKEEWKISMTNNEYAKFLEDGIKNIGKRPEANKPYPNHKKLWQTKISELDMDLTSFTPSINLATVEAGLLEGVVAEKKERGEPILLHLGSGDIYLGGWINCDLENNKADVLMDCSKIPLLDNSVQEIYNSHLLEHFDFMKGQEILKEWYRVLVPGGKLITETPDLLGLCQRFARSSEQERVDLYGLFFGMPWAENWNIHKFLYSETQLRWTLENLGFRDITRVPADSHFVPPEKTDVFLKLEAIKRPSISIIIPTLDHLEDLLKPCLESMQLYTDLNDKEIIIVANGCTDGTREYVESLGKPFKLLWFDESLGCPRLYNEGTKVANGNYIIFLNNDVVFPNQPKNEWVNLLLKPFKSDNKVGLTAPVKFTFDCKGTPKDAIAFWCVMIKREVFNKIGYLDEIFNPFGCEDIDFSIRAVNAGYRIVQVPTDITHKFLEEKPIMDFPIQHIGSKTVDEFIAYNMEEKQNLEKRNLNIIYDRYTSFLNKIQWRHPLVNGWGASQKPKELVMVSDFLKEHKIKKILEIGSFNGGSTIFWANMIGDDGVVYSADIAHYEKWYGGTEFEKQIIEMIGDSHDPSFKQKIFNTVGEVDMLFVDGDHSKEGVKDDFDSFYPLVRRNGFIVLHDIIDSEYHRSKGCFVALFWNEIKDKYKYFEFIDSRENSEIDTPVLSMGIGVILKEE